MRLVHLSRCPGPSDGGVAQAIAGLMRAQQAMGGLEPHWLTPERGVSFKATAHNLAPELLHVHGLWRAPNRLAASLQPQLPVVVAPHGMLDPWAFAQHRRRKTLLWWAYERRCLQSAATLQALCPAEAQVLRALGLRSPIAMIPNGVSLPESSCVVGAPGPLPPWIEAIPADGQVLLFLGRFHHKKGLNALLKAWQAVAMDAARAGWWLALVGYGDGGALCCQVAAAQARGELQRVGVFGPVFGGDKLVVLNSASAFVLPSHSEGLPMAALEAMAHRLPCLLSGACNLPQAFDAGAALAAEPDPAPLAQALQRLFALSPSERAAMGCAGQALVRERFSWPRVAKQTMDLYQWILGGGPRPDCVELA